MSFHADFNAFTMTPIFSSDGLPTNTGLSAGSFDQSTVSLLPTCGDVHFGADGDFFEFDGVHYFAGEIGVVDLVGVADALVGDTDMQAGQSAG